MYLVVVRRNANIKKCFLFLIYGLTLMILLLLIHWTLSWECQRILNLEKEKYFHSHNGRPKEKKAVAKKFPHNKDKKHEICYDVKNRSLKNILDESPGENSIFFMDVSCESYRKGRITLSKRRACAVEAASRLNTKKRVYVIFASPGILKNTGAESDVLLTALAGYKNVGFLHVDVPGIFKGTPVEKIYGAVQKSKYNEEFLKELLQLVILWRFGGTFVGFDLLFTKSLDKLAANFLAAKSGRIDDVVMRMDTGRKAKQFLNETLSEFSRVYGEGAANYTKGEIVTKTLKKLCESGGLQDIIAKYCFGIKIYPPSYFMPYRSENWKRYFDDDGQKVVKKVAGSFSIRLWEELSGSWKVYSNSTSAYTFLAKKYCPQSVKYSRNFI